MDQGGQNVDPDFETDYQHIRKDIKRVVIGNLVFLALLAGLYFANREYGFLSKLENFF